MSNTMLFISVFLVLLIALILIVIFYRRKLSFYIAKSYERSFSALPLPALILNDKCQLLFCNQSFTDLTGISSKSQYLLQHKDFGLISNEDELNSIVLADQVLIAKGTEAESTVLITDTNNTKKTGIYKRKIIKDPVKGKLLVGIFLDVTPLKTKQEQLVADMGELEKLIDYAPDMIVITDEENNILRVNHQTCVVSGFENEELLDVSVGSLLPTMLEPINSDLKGETNYQLILENVNDEQQAMLTTKSGQHIAVEINISPIEQQGNQIYLLSIRDITLRIENEEKLLKAKLQASFAQQSKSNFLSNMSHEIRTPMNAILGFSNLAKDQSSSKELTEYLAKIDSAAYELLHVISDILDLSKIDARNLNIENEVFDINQDVIEKTIQRNIKSIESKNLEVICYCDILISNKFIGDCYRINQVLNNLINNAVKFTSTGSITISLSNTSSDKGASLLFEVSDTGIGISENNMNNLFSLFEQIDSSATRQFGGTGLGLAISKALVELMGGTIGVSSEQGNGSTFWFEIPLEVYPEKYNEPELLADNANLRALIVDKSSVSVSIVSRCVKEFGVKELVSTTEASIAKKLIIEESDGFDFIMIDCDTNHYKSFELQTILSLANQKSNTKVIGMLNHSQVQGITEQDWSGYLDNIVEKPITHYRLSRSAAGILTKQKNQVQLSQDAALDEQQRNFQYDFSAISILLVEDNQMNQELAMAIFKKLGVNVTLARHGKEAIEKVSKVDSAFDLIFMDIQMPIVDGLKATKLIRCMPNYAQTPIIALTAHALKADREKSISAGMNDHITKPIKVKQVREKIISWLDLQPLEEILSQSVEETKIEQEPEEWSELIKLSLLSLNDVEARLEGNKIMIVNMINRYFQQQPIEVPKLINSLKSNNERAKINLHSFKGINQSIGFDKAASCCLELEQNFKEHNVYPLSTIEELEHLFTQFIMELQNINWHSSQVDGLIEDSDVNLALSKIVGLLKERDTQAVEDLEKLMAKETHHSKLIKACFDFASIYQFDKALAVLEEHIK